MSDLDSNRTSAGIVAAVISMTRSLGIRSVAEGVERIEELETLRELGCEEVQGFLYCVPLEADEVPAFLRDHRCWSPAKPADPDAADDCVQTSLTARMKGSSASMCWRGVVKPAVFSPISAAPVSIARIEKCVAPSAFQASAAARQRSGPSP